MRAHIAHWEDERTCCAPMHLLPMPKMHTNPNENRIIDLIKSAHLTPTSIPNIKIYMGLRRTNFLIQGLQKKDRTEMGGGKNS